MTWLTLNFIVREDLKFSKYVCWRNWSTRFTWGLLQNLDMYMSRNWVDLVDFDFHSKRRLKFLNICVSEKLVD